MSLRSLAKRLDRFGAGRCNPAECDGGPTVWLIDDGLSLTPMGGTRAPFDPATAARCPKCGEPHILTIQEMVVLPDGSKVPTGVYRRDRDSAGESVL